MSGTEIETVFVLIAAQIKVKPKGNARQSGEGILPFVDGDLQEVLLVLRFLNGDDFLVGIGLLTGFNSYHN